MLVSLGFTIVLLVEHHFCKYCLAAHVGNLAFWIVMEQKRRGLQMKSWRPVVSLGSVFVAMSLVLGITQQWTQEAAHAEFERDLASGIKDIIADRPSERGFTGRYHLGPENAAIRLVLFEDYQCENCRKVDREIRQILEERDDVSLSVKHFPMSNECNEHFPGNLHPDACWAARAAEAAGILRGDEGFWQMHHWLFDHDGSFSQNELRKAVAGFGYDPSEFVSVMVGERTLPRIKADIEEAIGLGLSFTPMIFINGVELRGKGIFANRAVPRAVEALAAANPPPGSAAQDSPPPAFEKYIDDWQTEKKVRIPPDESSWALGPDEAPVNIVVWGDYQEPYSAEADLVIRRLISDRSDARYAFRHYPINQSCNKQTKLTKHPLACRASQAAEAAGILGGPEAYWAMHDWLINDPAGFSDDTLRAVAADFGLDSGELFRTMSSPEVQTAIDEDTAAGKNAGLGSVPWIIVNGRRIPRWRKQGETVLQRIFDEAARGRSDE